LAKTQRLVAMGRNSLLAFDCANVDIISSVGLLDEGRCVQLILRLFPISTGRCVRHRLPTCRCRRDESQDYRRI